MDSNDYMQIPTTTSDPAPNLGPAAYGADPMATWRLALLLDGWAENHPDLDTVPDRDRGYILGLAHALRAVRGDELGNGDTGQDARHEVERATQSARDICASFNAWVDADEPA